MCNRNAHELRAMYWTAITIGCNTLLLIVGHNNRCQLVLTSDTVRDNEASVDRPQAAGACGQTRAHSIDNSVGHCLHNRLSHEAQPMAAILRVGAWDVRNGRAGHTPLHWPDVRRYDRLHYCLHSNLHTSDRQRDCGRRSGRVDARVGLIRLQVLYYLIESYYLEN